MYYIRVCIFIENIICNVNIYLLNDSTIIGSNIIGSLIKS